jgi:hypothetical protein
MLGVLINLLIVLLVLGLLFYAISLIPLPAPYGVIARAVFVVICVIVLLYCFVPWGTSHPLLSRY